MDQNTMKRLSESKNTFFLVKGFDLIWAQPKFNLLFWDSATHRKVSFRKTKEDDINVKYRSNRLSEIRLKEQVPNFQNKGVL